MSGRRASPHYAAYIKSIKWTSKATRWKRETGCCEKCGGTEHLEVHHLHYRTLCAERREDVQVLCRACHALVHNEDRQHSAYWNAYDTWCKKKRLDPEDDHTEEFAEWIESRRR